MRSSRAPGAPTQFRGLARRARQALEAGASLLHRQDYALLSIQSDLFGWVLDQEAIALERIARALGIRAGLDLGLARRARQCCHYTSQFVLESPELFATRQRVSVDYFHGPPGLAPQFRAVFEGLERHHRALARLRVSHAAMLALALESGIEPAKVRKIPIGVDAGRFSPQTPERRAEARRRLGLPESAVVVGSFQKDGVGWGEGLEPKLIKGPDVLLAALGLLASRARELWVLLTGPARGYVKRGLEEAAIPYRNVFLAGYDEVASCYQALDAYLVSSREEGGPEAVLEAMASGVPLVTTRVGQAADLVRHGENGLMVPVGDAEGLAHWTLAVLEDHALRSRVVAGGRETAEANCYEAQHPLWADFFRGYVEGW